MKKKLLLLTILLSNLCFADDIEFNYFTVFYPHLKNSMCRVNSFNILLDRELVTKEQKLNEWKKHEQTCSKDGSYQLIQADIYSVYRDYAEAKKILLSCIKNGAFDTRYHKFNLHAIYEDLNQSTKAFELIHSIIHEYPDFDLGYTALAGHYLEKRDWLSAKKNLEKALLLNNKRSETYNLLAIASYELMEDDKVHIYYDKALSFNPFKTVEDKHSTMRMAAVHIQEKDFSAAKKLLRSLLELNPSVKDDRRFVGLMQQCEEGLTKTAKK
jgi:tetratricopeptide (TPR) repeat protein